MFSFKSETEDAEPFAADLPEGSTLKRLSPMSPPESHQWEQAVIQESPQISSSEVSSPSQTPANFDFQKPEPSDPVWFVVVVVEKEDNKAMFLEFINFTCRIYADFILLFGTKILNFPLQCKYCITFHYQISKLIPFPISSIHISTLNII